MISVEIPGVRKHTYDSFEISKDEESGELEIRLFNSGEESFSMIKIESDEGVYFSAEISKHLIAWCEGVKRFMEK